MNINKYDELVKNLDAIKSALGRIAVILDDVKVEFSEPPIIEQKELKYN
jgi:hypothetical protein